MKRILKAVFLIGALAATFGCQKEQPVQERKDGSYEYRFAIKDIETKADADTKAVIGDSNVEWESTDIIGVFIGSTHNSAQMDVSKNPVMAVLKSSSAIPAGTKAYAYYPYDESNDDNGVVKITVSDSQNGSSVSAMPLAGIPFTVQEEISANASEGNGAIQFLNLGSLINFKIFSENSEYQNETIQSVEFSADNNATIAGSGYIDLTRVDASNASTLSLEFLDNADKKSSVLVNQSLAVASSKAGATPIKMVILPGQYSGTLTVTTDVASYSIAVPQFTFNRSGSRTFNLDLKNAERETLAPAKYVKITSVNDLVDGDYLIVYETDQVAFDGSLETLDTGHNIIEVSISNNEIVSSDDINGSYFHITSIVGGYSIKSASGSFIGRTTNSNGLNIGTSALVNSITFGESGNAVITSSAGPTLTFNSDNGDSNYRFRYYKTAQKSVALYFLEGSSDNRTTVTLSFTPANPDDININDSFTEPELTVSPIAAASAVTYSLTSEPANCASINATTGELSINAAGTITVTASIPEGNETYKPASASYTLTVIDPDAVDYVTLPWSYPSSGAATSAGIKEIDGVTTNGLGSDYGDNHSPYCIKLDGTGDYILVKTNEAIGNVSVKYKMIGGSTTSTLNILESSDGETFTTVQNLSISGAQNSTGELTTTNTFAPESRYVKINFTKGSNVGIGGISIMNTTPSFSVESPLEVSASGGSSTVSISRLNFTGAINVSVPDGCDWISTTDVAANSNSFRVTVDANSGAARNATLILSGTGVEPQNLVVNQVGSEPGTEANPYTVAQAIEVANALGNNATTPNEVYITGTVSTVDTYNASYKSITYYISSDGNASNELEVYSGKGLNGADFSDITDLAVGDQVIIKGQLKKYYNSTSESTILEVNTSSQIISITKTARYTVNLLTVTNGTINASATSVGAHGIVTLTATPAPGYELDSWDVKDASNNPITVTDNKFTMPASNVTVSATFKTKTTTDVTDVLNRASTGVTGTSYSDWSGKKSASDAVYAGNSAGGNDSIQLRTNNNNSGIVSTSSGGKLVKVAVTWNSNTAAGRKILVYGKNTAYENASDLYDANKQGTLLGTIDSGSSTVLNISGDYTFIGIKSSSGALYLDEVDITWTK